MYYKLKAILLSVIASLFLSGCIEYSEGEKYGTIVKFSNKGLWTKTWEGELATFAKGQTATMFNNTFLFSVLDQNVVNKIKTAGQSGQTVALVYKQQLFYFPWQSETPYWIVDVRYQQ